MPHFQDNFTVLKPQFEFVQSLTEGLPSDVVKLFRHILASTYIQARDYHGKTPVSAQLIKDEAPKATYPAWLPLVERNLMHYIDFSKADGKSRVFIISPWVLKHYQQLNPLTRNEESAYDEYETISKVNLFTGEPARHRKSSVHINGNKVSDLVSQAIRTFDACYYDREALTKHMGRMLSTYYDRCRCAENPETEENECKAFYRLVNDEACRQYIGNRNPIPHTQPGIFAFEPYYESTRSGRITSNLQSATREMKFALYGKIDRMHNYDLKSSQAVILRHLMEQAEIPCEWLDDYLKTDNPKEVYAEKAGLTAQEGEDCWKNCLYALFMGAELPSQTQNPDKFYSIEKYLYDYLEDKSELTAVYERFNKLVSPLRESIILWHTYLLKKYAYNPANYTKAGGRRYVYNACEMKYCVDDPKKTPQKIKRELAAHILQGQEACFIHHLTLLGKDYGYQPIGNEHDGLIVIGEIPDEAVKEAKKHSDMPDDAILVPKNTFSENSTGLLLDESSGVEMDIII